MQYFIGLGSNLGNRVYNLAICHVELTKCGIRIILASSIYATEPRLVSAQPWFLNQVLEIDSDLKPHELLVALEKLENKMGRNEKNTQGPRIIDIDILMAGELVINNRELMVPHPRITERLFVLVPWREIAPNTCHPVISKTIQELCEECRDKSEVFLYRPEGNLKNS